MNQNVELAQLILYAAGLVLLGAFGWIIKTVRDLTTEIAAWRVALFGLHGDGGMGGDITKLREDVDTLLLRHSRRETDVGPRGPQGMRGERGERGESSESSESSD